MYEFRLKQVLVETCEPRLPRLLFSRELKQRLFVNEVVVANRILFLLREDVSIYRTNLKYCGKSPKFVFPSTSIFCSPICSSNCGVAFFVKIYFSFREMIFFVRLLKYANFHREYYPSCVTSCNECTRSTVFLWT